jgi:antirestriction protein ArdC
MPRAATSPSRPAGDLYTRVTAQIVAAIEAGETSYSFPWHTVPGLPRNIVSRRTYRGINTLLLWLTGQAQGYATPDWATFNQWRERGMPVRRGERASQVVFWQPRPAAGAKADQTQVKSDADEPDRGRSFLARVYSVFNAGQVEGYSCADMPRLPDSARDAAADRFFANLPLEITHEGDKAYYHPVGDRIHLPPFERFRDAQAYYATRGHESVHATGAAHRLDRKLTTRFGTEAYAVEELVAELGSAFLCAALGLAPEPRPDHAGYIASWLKVLKGDTRAIFTAAGQAQAAVDWLQGQQPGVEST